MKNIVAFYTLTKLLLFLSLSLAVSNLNAQIQIGQDIDGEAAGDNSGNSVSLSADGQILAVGAYLNGGNGAYAGHVRVYQKSSGTWQQIGQDIDGEAAGDMSGISVSLSADGNILAIGAPFNYSNVYPYPAIGGHVRVYQNIAGDWQQIGQDIDCEAEGDWSGNAVSLSADGQIVAIGASHNDGNGTDAGHVRVYQNNSGTWTQVGNDIDGEATSDMSGFSVSLSTDGNTVAIGAAYNDGNGADAGHVRVYYNNSGTWQQIGQDIDGEAAGDRSGWSVSLSADGNTITIGAKGNSGNGTEAGHVRVYKNNSDTWYQIAQDIDGEAAGDNSGSSVSLSADGNLAAIGAIYNDGNGTDSTGHVRVFALKGFFGKIYNDINDNCIADATEPGLAGRGVYITPGNYTLQTNEMGIWQIDSLLSGSYTVTVDTSGNWLPTCPISQTFTVTDPEGITVAPSFGFISIQPCAGPNVSVNMPFMRWGFSNQQIYVQVCNDYIATGALLDAYVDLELDSLISVDNASLGYADLGENSYRFNLGDINLGQCVAFSLSSTLSTEAILG